MVMKTKYQFQSNMLFVLSSKNWFKGRQVNNDVVTTTMTTNESISGDDGICREGGNRNSSKSISFGRKKF